MAIVIGLVVVLCLIFLGCLSLRLLVVFICCLACWRLLTVCALYLLAVCLLVGFVLVGWIIVSRGLLFGSVAYCWLDCFVGWWAAAWLLLCLLFIVVGLCCFC